jgi:hypothetical protein
MKSVLISILLSLSILVNAQLKVASDGNVGIGTTIPSANLHVKWTNSSAPYAFLKLESGGIGQNASIQFVNEGVWRWELGTGITAGSTFELLNRVNLKTALAIKDNGNVGIGTNSPACPFQVSTPSSGQYSYNSRFSCYHPETKCLVVDYQGNESFFVYGNGFIIARGSWINSDERFKENIQDFNDVSNLLNLKPVSYSFKKGMSVNLKAVNSSDSAKLITPQAQNSLQEEPDKITSKKQFGFIAQDVQKIYPDLVLADEKGYLSVNYTAFIPIIVQALKVQQAKNILKDSIINSLNNQVITLQKAVALQEQSMISLQNQIEDIKKNCCTSKTKSVAVDNNQNQEITLYQNAPNPFTQTTEIKFFLPETVTSASLIICNMQGNMIRTITISSRGNGGITINGSELKAGMYLYSLIADGTEIDTKRMILTN